jgi:HSP20 family protein
LADTDGDGLSDGDEVNTYTTDPILADTDGDGLTDDVEVKLVGRTLTVETERSREERVEEDDGQFIRQERSRSTSSQQVEFPASVRGSDAAATMQNGVLTVTVPKTDTEQDSTRVDIE